MNCRLPRRHRGEWKEQARRRSSLDGYCKRYKRHLHAKRSLTLSSQPHTGRGRNACHRKARTHCERKGRHWETGRLHPRESPEGEGRMFGFSAVACTFLQVKREAPVSLGVVPA